MTEPTDNDTKKGSDALKDKLPLSTEPVTAAQKKLTLTSFFHGIKNSISLTLWLFIGLSCFLLWAAFFEIEQSVRATGQVIPSARTQIIQATDGGVLLEILVEEGQTVKQDQLLAVLEKDRANAAYQEIKARVMALKATLIRCEAEVNNIDPIYPDSFSTYPDIVKRQLGFYSQRKKALEDELDTHQSNLKLAKKELTMNKNLFKTGDISQVELMKSQRQVTEFQGKLSAAKNKYLSEARQEAAKVQGDLATTEFKLNEKRDILEHTELRAPVDGTVKYLRFNTLGGVLKAGDELMQITPTESGMIIETKINPVDIAQLHIGQLANVKVDAFDYTTYGGLDGTLIYLSSDTLTEQQKESEKSDTFYRAYIRVHSNQQQTNPKLSANDLKPGMTATADIRTKNRTVLKYIVKPIARAFDGALKQR
ncbi:MAG: HlyD family efflux transporter periplasmic adaptor subunit [Cellvibrionales bacterium]|nr:HlyD family efflux transporter periplasmic adaptor subunit [Cellvibrionales bacterium]